MHIVRNLYSFPSLEKATENVYFSLYYTPFLLSLKLASIFLAWVYTEDHSSSSLRWGEEIWTWWVSGKCAWRPGAPLSVPVLFSPCSLLFFRDTPRSRLQTSIQQPVHCGPAMIALSSPFYLLCLSSLWAIETEYTVSHFKTYTI